MALKFPALILPGHTDFHATSCARYLEECIPSAEYWDVPLESQPPDRIRDCILAFLAAHTGAAVHTRVGAVCLYTAGGRGTAVGL